MKDRKIRQLKVYGQSNGYNYTDVPTIVLKGKWLKEVDFDIGAELLVQCEKEKITITVVKK